MTASYSIEEAAEAMCKIQEGKYPAEPGKVWTVEHSGYSIKLALVDIKKEA